MIETVVKEYPTLAVIATTLRHAKTATLNDWGALCYGDGSFHEAPVRENLEIYDRVGGGDSFASGTDFMDFCQRRICNGRSNAAPLMVHWR